MRHRLVIGYAIDGDLRFISHHDTIRMFERALARAALPVKFSEGFNPRPRLSLPLPRPVGVASDDETLVVECTGPIEPRTAMETLAPQMPAGVMLKSARYLQDGSTLSPQRACYRIQFDGPVSEALRERVTELLALERLEVTRNVPGQNAERSIDIRPGLLEVTAQEDRVEWTLAILPQGAARPGEVIGALGLVPADWLYRVRRTAVHFG